MLTPEQLAKMVLSLGEAQLALAKSQQDFNTSMQTVFPLLKSLASTIAVVGQAQGRAGQMLGAGLAAVFQVMQVRPGADMRVVAEFTELAATTTAETAKAVEQLAALAAALQAGLPSAPAVPEPPALPD